MTRRQDTTTWQLLHAQRESMFIRSQYARKKVVSRRRRWRWKV